MRVNRGQKFVIGGYTIGANGFDAVIFGYYDGDKLIYAGRTRNGFTPASRDQLSPVSATWDQRLPVCQPARIYKWALGPGSYSREDGGLPVAHPRAGGAVRVCRVD